MCICYIIPGGLHDVQYGPELVAWEVTSRSNAPAQIFPLEPVRMQAELNGGPSVP